MQYRNHFLGIAFLLLSAAFLSAQTSEQSVQARITALRRAANVGNAGAQMFLGASYEQGWTGIKNFKQALKWFRKAAAQGDADAENALGQMYEDGEGVKQNYELAAQWYRKAAEHVPDFGGAGQGRDNLGLLYMQGLGVPQDLIQAHLWFALAHSEQNLRQVQRKMSPEQIFQAQRLADQWKQEHNLP